VLGGKSSPCCNTVRPRLQQWSRDTISYNPLKIKGI
jgi:hypothetical protein